MTLTHEIYRDLYDALFTEKKDRTLSKICSFENGLSVIYAVSWPDGLRKLYVKITDENIDAIPKCQGLEMRKVHLYEYSLTDFYLEIAQNGNSESYIFETIIEDIRRTVSDANQGNSIITIVSNVLLKWKTFFAQEKSLLLSQERQQGLYGELNFLQELIEKFGPIAVAYWTGCNYETHDFYIRGNAVEVKTTVTKAPYKMHISSEYQLDDAEVENNLYLRFYALRKSTSDGESLVQLVESLREALNPNLAMLKRFNHCLEEYGYFDGMEEKYQIGYHVRESATYCVSDNFPRIIPKMLCKGVTGCSYDVLTLACDPFGVTSELFFDELKGGD